MFAVLVAVVCLVSTGLALLIAKTTMPRVFDGPIGDAQAQVYAAANFSRWKWPSRMHEYAGVRARMKDVSVLMLVATQRILREKSGTYPVIIVCNAANIVSSVMVFLIAADYWSLGVGLLAVLLYVTSFWPYQIVVQGGFQVVAQMILLISVWLVQQVEGVTLGYSLMWYGGSGIAVGLMMFASASSRKLLPLYAGALLFSQREALGVLELSTAGWQSPLSPIGIVWMAAVAALISGGLFGWLTYRRVVTAVYQQKGPRILSRLTIQRDQRPLERYLTFAKTVVILAIKTGVALGIYAGLVLFSPLPGTLFLAHLTIALGFLIIVVIFTLPDVIENIKRYFRHWGLSSSQDGTHFRLYMDYFERIGRPIKADMRGAGWRWVNNYFWRVVPFHMALALISLGLIGYAIYESGGVQSDMWKALGILAVAVAPVAWGEFTKGPQVGRSYFAGFLGLLVLIAYGAAQKEIAGSSLQTAVFWVAAGGWIVAGGAWNLWILVGDVLPARRAVANLNRTLKELGVKEFYTYDTPYNDCFVQCLPPADKKDYQIKYINNLEEVEDGYVVVPGTSAKAADMESQHWSIKHGDFDLDPELTRLIKTKEITKYAVASFKAPGNSRIWLHEGEVPSYRDLILKEVSDEDRWRGRVWVLDATKLRTARLAQDQIITS